MASVALLLWSYSFDLADWAGYYIVPNSMGILCKTAVSMSQDVYFYILSSSKSNDKSSHGFGVQKNSKNVYDKWTREMDPSLMKIVTDQCSEFIDYFGYPRNIL